MKCFVHGCEMAVVKLGVGWGSESERECPECEKEQDRANGNSQKQTIFSTSGRGWGNR